LSSRSSSTGSLPDSVDVAFRRPASQNATNFIAQKYNWASPKGAGFQGF
jgi:hypothetical protein